MADTTYTRPGSPGASAQRVYETLAQQAEAWAVGAAGERAVGRRLRTCRRCVVLSDRAWPGRRANLDHVVVAPSGVLVVDTKAYLGRVKSDRPRLLPKAFDAPAHRRLGPLRSGGRCPAPGRPSAKRDRG